MNLDRPPLRWILPLGIATFVISPFEARAETLWRIGTSDDSTAEFALAPDGFRDFSKPGAFIVGTSRPADDWPYISPGPEDAWVGPETPRASRIWFALSKVPRTGSTLVLDLCDTHESSPPEIRVSVNGRVSDHRTAPGHGNYLEATGGRGQTIRIPVPADALRTGVNRISITNSENSWLTWDHVTFDAGRGAELGEVADDGSAAIESVGSTIEVFRDGADKVRRVSVQVVHLGDPVEAVLSAGSSDKTVALAPGVNDLTIDVPAVEEPVTVPVELRIGSTLVDSDSILLDNVREWTVHLIHQTHLDIGYTHFQEEVLERQVEYFRRALELIEETKDYPEGARFIWHPEGMWAVEEFLRVAAPEEREAFVEACRERKIHLDVLYAQAMSGLYTEEELMELMSSAKRFEKEHGVAIDSAMLSDVPGYTWGLTTALAANDVHHISLGPNASHRVGHTYRWGDRPFYWETPDGRDRILFWLTSKGYSMFHGGTPNPTSAEQNQLLLKMDDILGYLGNLDEAGYSHDMTMLRYAIGADNGPPDPTLCDVVRDWNETHVSPRFVIDTNSGFLSAFEERYGDELPVMRGDFTPYWEDGAASTAKATGVNREACERIAQAQVLWSMKGPGMPLHERFDTAWHKLIMYDEHTWGAYNSISDPDSRFAIQQDAYKQAYAFDGASLTRDLLRDIAPPAAAGPSVDIHNTASWSRGGLVVLDEESSAAGDLVRDHKGDPVSSQRLSSGELAFMAGEVPAFGTRRYTLHDGTPPAAGAASASGNGISNETLELKIDPGTGAISSLKRKDAAGDWVDTSQGSGLNDYLYILGRDPEQGRDRVSGPVTITVEESGPLVATLRIESGAPGAAKLTRRVRLVAGRDHVELVNTVDKHKVRDPEGVYFGFPFDLPDAIPRVDTPWASIEVDSEQLPGANRNFYCVQRFVDLANSERGVTWVTVDAPLVQFDPIRIAPIRGTEAFPTSIDPGSFLWSWTMNNHWETNYKADQEGEITFRYALRPYTGGHDPAASERFGRGICQPLLAVAAEPESDVGPPLLALQGDAAIIATQVRPSRDGRAWMVRLFNSSDVTASTRLEWNRPVGTTKLSNPMEEALEPSPAEVTLVPQQVLTLRVERAEIP